MTDGGSELTKLSERSRTILRQIVESYLETGEPVGSRNLSRVLPMALSPASIRNVMSDLEQLGLIVAPHTSAGRLPTQLGLRLFVDGLLEVGDLTSKDRRQIEAHIAGKRTTTVDDVLREVGEMISGLSHCAGVVLADKQVTRLKHIEFVLLEPGKALVVLVGDDQTVENRIINLPQGLPPSALVEAANYLNAHVRGFTMGEARARIEQQLQTARQELDELTKRVVATGTASWAGGDGESALIVRGQSHLLEDVTALADLERLRTLFEMLETKETVLRLLDASKKAEGVQIFIGAENHLFGVAGCSMIIAPYQNSREQIVGAIGVIGPTRINYARIIPMVDYTAKVIGRIIG